MYFQSVQVVCVSSNEQADHLNGTVFGDARSLLKSHPYRQEYYPLYQHFPKCFPSLPHGMVAGSMSRINKVLYSNHFGKMLLLALSRFLYCRTWTCGHKGDTVVCVCQTSLTTEHLFLLKFTRRCYKVDEFSLNNLTVHLPIPLLLIHSDILL